MDERYPRVYDMLKLYGHTPAKAIQIMLDASRGDWFSIMWIRMVHRTRTKGKPQ